MSKEKGRTYYKRSFLLTDNEPLSTILIADYLWDSIRYKTIPNYASASESWCDFSSGRHDDFIQLLKEQSYIEISKEDAMLDLL